MVRIASHCHELTLMSCWQRHAITNRHVFEYTRAPALERPLTTTTRSGFGQRTLAQERETRSKRKRLQSRDIASAHAQGRSTPERVCCAEVYREPECPRGECTFRWEQVSCWCWRRWLPANLFVFVFLIRSYSSLVAFALSHCSRSPVKRCYCTFPSYALTSNNLCSATHGIVITLGVGEIEISSE